MSFWNLNDGGDIDNTGEFEIEGGDLEPIPAKTGCIAAIEEASWDDYEGDRYINIKWRVMRPEEYGNRVIFHKVKVFGTSRDKDPEATADKAKRMLAAIDANAGGKLMKIQGEPTDQDLMSCLAGKTMAIKVMVWKMKMDDGETKQGNWISAVSPAKGAAKAKAKPAKAALVDSDDDFDDDIPF